MPSDSFLRRYLRFWGASPENDVADEISFHFEMRMAELQRAGMSEAAARHATLERFGDPALIRKQCEALSQERVERSRRADQWDALSQDIRYAFRTLKANRGFALMVALTMAIGIGATTAVFSVAYGVLLRPLPYHDADGLIRLWSRNAERGLEFFSVSPADFQVWRQQSTTFSAIGAFERQHDATLSQTGAADSSEFIEASAVTPEVFSLLGTSAQNGRALVPDDARPGAPAVAVLGHDLWNGRFGSDPTIVGKDIRLDGDLVTVVGVMPARFFVPGTPAQIWTPLSLAGASPDHGNRYLRVLARLAPGISMAAARTRMDVIAAGLTAENPGTNTGWSVNSMSIHELVIGRQFRRAVLVLLGVVGFVLLIACANGANLQLARAAARRREIALRAALGATRGRVLRQLLTESAVLALCAGVLGLLLAYGGVELLRAVGTTTVPRLQDIRLDWPVLGFTAVIALGSGILFGLLPALRASRPDTAEALKGDGTRGTAGGAAGQGLRSALVIAEVSLSVVLLVGAGLLTRSFLRLQSVELGFDPQGVLVVPIRLPQSAYPEDAQAERFQAALLDRISQLRGVVATGAVSSAPFAGPNTGLAFAAVDQPALQENAPDADYRTITPGYLRTLGIPLKLGRDFTEQDRVGAPAVILISEALARRTWPDQNPIGRSLRIGDVLNGPTLEVVGVVADARYQSLETPEVRPMMYLSALARPTRAMMIVARGVDPAALAAGVRQEIATLDPTLPAPRVRPLEDGMETAVATRRFALILFGLFAGTALILAGVGIYGVISYLVRQRMHEMGIRIALGATPARLMTTVVGGALKLTAVGVTIGLLGAWGLTRLLSALLFDVSPTDLPTYAAVGLLLVLVAGLAGLIPARRATRVDPVLVLRGDW